jgi:hypothetical protein
VIIRRYLGHAWLLCESGEIEVKAELFVQDTPLGISWHGTLRARLDWFEISAQADEFALRTADGKVGTLRLNQPLVFVDQADITGIGPAPF